jgi:tetratricopeptide (TPR) repeat protein
MKEMIAYSHRLTRILYTAAAFSLMLAVFASYLYQKASPQRLFSDYYQHYNRPTMRGSSDGSPLKTAYADSNQDAVIREFQASRSPEPEEYLLAGIAFIEVKQPGKAIETFQALIQKNKTANSDFFEDDAEYYLAMAYLDNREPEKAMPIFTKIQANPENSYNSFVDEWFMLKIRTSIAMK